MFLRVMRPDTGYLAIVKTDMCLKRTQKEILKEKKGRRIYAIAVVVLFPVT